MHGGATARRGRVLAVASLSAAALGVGGPVAMADEPVQIEVVVQVGPPPVPPTTVTVEVGVPPVPPAVAVDLPPLPPLPDTFGDPAGEVGRPPLPPLPDTFGGVDGEGTEAQAAVSSIAGAIAATADAAWRTA